MGPDSNKDIAPRIIPEQKKDTPKTGRLASFRKSLSGTVKSLNETFAITEKKVPVEEIDTQTVAKTILNRLGNPLRERMGDDRYANPFDITSVIAELGYVGVLNSTDYLKKFPGVYNAVRQSLWGLEQAGVLESKDFEPNSHGESKYYKVVDKHKLQTLSVNKPQKSQQ